MKVIRVSFAFLLAMIILFMIVACFIVEAFAINYQYEAESMTIDFGWVTDAGDHVIMMNNSKLSFLCNAENIIGVSVYAKEDHYPDRYSQLEITVDGVVQDTIEITSTEWGLFELSKSMPSGIIGLEFVNPKYQAGVGDNNIYIDYIVIDDCENPEPPMIDTLYVDSNHVTITWDANTEEDLAGYELYVGNQTGVYGTLINVGKVTQYDLLGLDWMVDYYVAVTAYDLKNNESGYSDEVSFFLVPPSENVADVNNDGRVDIQDVMEVIGGIKTGDPKADLNKDNRSDIQDLIVVIDGFKNN
jgi:hypothetical protein